VLNCAALPDWYAEAEISSKAYGDELQKKKRSLILIVPSVVARIEMNILINPEHPEFVQVEHSLHHPVWWDKRLFAP
jgi:RES domain-containing protein